MKLRFFIWFVFLLFATKSHSEDMQIRHVKSSKDIPLREYIMENKVDNHVAYFVTDPMATDTIVMFVTVQYTPDDTVKGTYRKFYDIEMFEKSNRKRKSTQRITCYNDTTINAYTISGKPNATFKSIQAREVKNIIELVKGIKTTELDMLKTMPRFSTNVIYIQFIYGIVQQ